MAVGASYVNERLYTTKEAAKKLSISQFAVLQNWKRWQREGVVRGVVRKTVNKDSKGKDLLFPASDVRRIRKIIFKVA